MDEPFQNEILDAMIVYPGRRLEVRLNLLPAKWRSVLDAIAHIRRQSGCHYDPSVPTKGSKWDQEQKIPELQRFPALFQTKNLNVPISGYLFSMKLEQERTRRNVKLE